MKPAERDAALLWDMLQACREIRQFTGDAGLEDFVSDRKLCLAVERSFEIVGEAAGRVSLDCQAAVPSIPWRKIRGMRNILAHEYGQIDYEIIYTTVTDELPALIAALEALLQ